MSFLVGGQFMMNPFQLQAAASKKYANLMLQIQSMQVSIVSASV
jgi:hypothetical protein